MTKEWVTTHTFSDDAGMLRESGAVVAHKPRWKAGNGARELMPGEPEAVCPRCGARFAETEDGTAEQNRDLHLNGDEDIPSICLDQDRA